MTLVLSAIVESSILVCADTLVTSSTGETFQGRKLFIKWDRFGVATFGSGPGVDDVPTAIDGLAGTPSLLSEAVTLVRNRFAQYIPIAMGALVAGFDGSIAQLRLIDFQTGNVHDATSLGQKQLLAFPCQPPSFGVTYVVTLPATAAMLKRQMRMIQTNFAAANPSLTAAPFQILSIEHGKPPSSPERVMRLFAPVVPSS